MKIIRLKEDRKCTAFIKKKCLHLDIPDSIDSLPLNLSKHKTDTPFATSCVQLFTVFTALTQVVNWASMAFQNHTHGITVFYTLLFVNNSSTLYKQNRRQHHSYVVFCLKHLQLRIVCVPYSRQCAVFLFCILYFWSSKTSGKS